MATLRGTREDAHETQELPAPDAVKQLRGRFLFTAALPAVGHASAIRAMRCARRRDAPQYRWTGSTALIPSSLYTRFPLRSTITSTRSAIFTRGAFVPAVVLAIEGHRSLNPRLSPGPLPSVKRELLGLVNSAYREIADVSLFGAICTSSSSGM